MLILNRKKTSLSALVLPMLPMVLGLALTTGCSKKSDQAQVDAAVQRMKDGQLVQAVENSNKGAGTAQTISNTSGTGSQPQAAAVADPCPDAVIPKADATDEEMTAGINAFGACMRTQYEPVNVAQAAIEYFKAYTMPSGERPLSAMTDEEIKQYVQDHYMDPLTFLASKDPNVVEQAARARGSFTDAELDEFLALVARKRAALESSQARVFAAMETRKDLIEHYAKTVNRYALLKALKDNANDADGVATAQAIDPILGAAHMHTPSDASQFPVAMLHPYGALSAVPDEGMEEKDLDRQQENPYIGILRAIADLEGSAESVAKTREVYAKVRDLDNPPLPEHDPAAADAVRVAFIDSGIDFVTHPDLGLFLGNGQNGQMSSGDYADGDSNPWLLSVGEFGHGSGTSATLLTIMAHYAPETLQSRKLDLAMWKVFSLRDLLSGDAQGMGRWDSRSGMHEAIIRRIEGNEVKPKIVSVSMGFTFQEGAKLVGREGVLLKAPWLWVMAAGNSGVDLHQENYKTCFDDVPKEQRVDDRILCVGALIPGIVNDKIASYSNFGDRVDVYAFESYIGLCPNGTSCATPAVSGAAAVIAAKYPSLSPEQIKKAIVGASEEKTLDIDYSYDPQQEVVAKLSGLPTTRTVKVFNPPAMLPKALEIAKALAESPAGSPADGGTKPPVVSTNAAGGSGDSSASSGAEASNKTKKTKARRKHRAKKSPNQNVCKAL